MNRRQKGSALVRLAALAALLSAGLPSTVLAQTADRPVRIGLIAFGDAELRGHLEQSLIEGLRQRGLVEGKNLVFERRYASGRGERVPELASELAGLKLDAILTTCTPTTHAMHKVARSTPLVMAAVSDPVGQGLIASYARPGGNITGLASQFEDVAAKMLDLFREAVPQISSVSVLSNPRNPVHKVFLHDMAAAAQRLKVSLVSIPIGHPTDIPAAFESMQRDGVTGVMVLPDDPFLLNIRRRIVEQAVQRRLPIFVGHREAVEDGGLMSYGESLSQSYFRASGYLDKVVRGTSPSELPVEQPIKFEMIVNLKTAKALGLIIPQSILLRADEVIE